MPQTIRPQDMRFRPDCTPLTLFPHRHGFTASLAAAFSCHSAPPILPAWAVFHSLKTAGLCQVQRLTAPPCSSHCLCRQHTIRRPGCSAVPQDKPHETSGTVRCFAACMGRPSRPAGLPEQSTDQASTGSGLNERLSPSTEASPATTQESFPPYSTNQNLFLLRGNHGLTDPWVA